MRRQRVVAIKSKLIKVLISLLSAILISSTLGMNMDAAAAPRNDIDGQSPKNHTFHSVTYQKVYAHPDSRKEEGAFLYAILTLHPALGSIKVLREALVAVGIWQGFQELMRREENAKKAQGYYIVEKRMYKSKKPTKYYWGFSQTYIYSSALRTKVKGKTLVVGKTSY
jgi:hypothetical protein